MPDVELTVVVPVAEQLFEPVTVTVYVAATKPVIVAEVPPLLHKYVGPVAPVTLTVAVPSLVLLQLTLVSVTETPIAVGWEMVTDAVAEHEFASNTVTV